MASELDKCRATYFTLPRFCDGTHALTAEYTSLCHTNNPHFQWIKSIYDLWYGGMTQHPRLMQSHAAMREAGIEAGVPAEHCASICKRLVTLHASFLAIEQKITACIFECCSNAAYMEAWGLQYLQALLRIDETMEDAMMDFVVGMHPAASHNRTSKVVLHELKLHLDKLHTPPRSGEASPTSPHAASPTDSPSTKSFTKRLSIWRNMLH